MATPHITQYHIPRDASLDSAITDIQRELDKGRTVTVVRGGITLYVQGTYAPCSMCLRPATTRPADDTACPACTATKGAR